MKLKVYFYPGSRDPSEQEKAGYVNCVPFSPQGIERWIEPTDNPDEAQLFYCGQFHDKDAWRLSPGRFEFLQGRELKHVFDVEGDWRGMDIPEWLKPCVLTVMNAREKNRGWNIMARPGCSKLLVHLAREAPSGFRLPSKKQFWFRGQQDSGGLRMRLSNILEDNFVTICKPKEVDFQFNSFWGAVLDVNHQEVAEYRRGMEDSTFILCPGGEGWGATLRMYEACYFGRVPILIADCLWAWEDVTDVSFASRISPHASDDEMGKALADIFAISDSELEDRCRMAALYFEHVVRFYFRDPTEFLMMWLGKKRLI